MTCSDNIFYYVRTGIRFILIIDPEFMKRTKRRGRSILSILAKDRGKGPFPTLHNATCFEYFKMRFWLYKCCATSKQTKICLGSILDVDLHFKFTHVCQDLVTGKYAELIEDTSSSSLTRWVYLQYLQIYTGWHHISMAGTHYTNRHRVQQQMVEREENEEKTLFTYIPVSYTHLTLPTKA